MWKYNFKLLILIVQFINYFGDIRIINLLSFEYLIYLYIIIIIKYFSFVKIKGVNK